MGESNRVDPELARQAACVEALAGAQRLAVGALRDGNLVHASAALRRMFALPEGEIGTSFTALVAAPERERVARALAVPDGAALAFRAVRADGSLFEAEVLAVSGALPDGPATVLAVSDLTERERAARELSYLALVDPETGLPNRQAFQDRVRAVLSDARRAGRPAVVMIVEVQAGAGHDPAPSRTRLRELGAQLRHCVRETDMVARLETTQFGVVLPRVDERGRAALPAARLLAALAGRASIGVAAYPDDAASAEALLEGARLALGEARGAENSSVAFAAPTGSAGAELPAFVPWNARYAVGVEVLDGQHQELLELINRLGEGLRSGRDFDELVDALRELVRYTEHHFATEERLMDELGARSERHRAEHRRLVDDLMRLTLRLDLEGVSQSAAFLRDWLFRHIDEVDRPFAAYLRNHGLR